MSEYLLRGGGVVADSRVSEGVGGKAEACWGRPVSFVRSFVLLRAFVTDGVLEGFAKCNVERMLVLVS